GRCSTPPSGARAPRGSPRPQRSEVDTRIAWLEPTAEVVDGRMDSQPFELVAFEKPVPPHRLVPRDDVGERTVDLAGEDDVDDMLRPEAPLRRDRLHDRDGPLDRNLVAVVNQSRLLRELTRQRVRQAFPAVHAAAG